METTILAKFVFFYVAEMNSSNRDRSVGLYAILVALLLITTSK